MSAQVRLDQLQTKLVAAGVKDVKFYFSREAMGTPVKAAEGAAMVLEAYLSGQCKTADAYIKPVGFETAAAK